MRTASGTRAAVYVAVVAAATGLVLVGLALASQGWNPLAFATIGPRFDQGDPGAVAGYDGQFVYYIALDPLAAAAKMDAPVYRYQRILYPVLGWLLSAGGRPALLPWVLIAINLIAMAAEAGLLAGLLVRVGGEPWYALLVSFSIGGLFTLRGNLTEHLSLALSLAGLAWLLAGRHGAAAAALALGGLAKETALLYSAGGVLWLLAQRRWRAAAGLAIGSGGPLIVWNALLATWLGQTAFATERTAFELLPFYGMRFVFPSQAAVMLLLWVVLPTAALLWFAVVDLRRWHRTPSPASPAGLCAWCVVTTGLFIALAPRASYVDLLAMMRLMLAFMAAALLWLAGGRRRYLPWLAALWAPSALLVFLIPGFFLAP